MTNAFEHVRADEIRAQRATRLDAMLKDERWTNRKIAGATGLTHTYIGRRLSGSLDLSFSDVELFARLLKMTPEALFEELLHIPTKKAPGRGGPGASLPDLDSNQEPAGFPPAPIRLVPRSERTAEKTILAKVTPIRSNAS